MGSSKILVTRAMDCRRPALDSMRVGPVDDGDHTMFVVEATTQPANCDCEPHLRPARARIGNPGSPLERYRSTSS